MYRILCTFPFLSSYQSISPGQRHFWTFRNMIRFYVEELLAPRPTPKLEDHPLSAAFYWLFNTFAATLHIGDCFPIRNLSTRHFLLAGTHLSLGATISLVTSVHPTVCLSVCLSFFLSVCLSVCMEQICFHWTEFHEIDVSVFFENLSRKFEIY